MIPAQALTRILAVQPALGAVERDQAAPRSAFAFEHLALGQKVAGQVLSQSKGVSLVLIEGQTVAMRLPPHTAPGDTLKLRFSGHVPQPVFLLESPETAPRDTSQLSQTARLLSEIMQRAPERAPPTLTPAAPLLDRPPALPAELALALRTALVRSGLFYESHLANWVAGRDSVNGLMQEPQNRLTADAARTASLAATPIPGAALALSDAGNTGIQKLVNPLHTLLTQQLQVLESPQFVWRGELWPGQSLEWQVLREARCDAAGRPPAHPEREHQETDAPQGESAAPASNEAASGWESRLKLTLPQLGAVTVHIRLDAHQGVSIRMAPEQAGVEPLLQQHQARLAERLTTAGCALQSVAVQSGTGSSDAVA